MWLFQRQAAAAAKANKKVREKERAKARAAKRRARKKKKPTHNWPLHKPYNPDKVKYIPVTEEQIEELVALSKGKIPTTQGEWFYGQFIRFSNGMAKTPEHVRQRLEDAHWVEEEDLRQQIHIILWILRSKAKVIRDEHFYLTAALRIYLARDEKVFHKDRSRFEAMYQYELELSQLDQPIEQAKNLDIVFEQHHMFSTFDRYATYLYYCLGQTEDQLAKTLLLGLGTAKSIKRSLEQKIQESEEKHGSRQIATRCSKPTLAIFTGR